MMSQRFVEQFFLHWDWCASNPLLNVLKTLSKYSHNNDRHRYQRNLCYGLVGAGTNNACLAQMLRQLASYDKKSNCSFIVRIFQVKDLGTILF